MVMIRADEFMTTAVNEASRAGKTFNNEVVIESPWWSGAVVDSALGFSAILVFVLGGVLLLRKWIRQRGHWKSPSGSKLS